MVTEVIGSEEAELRRRQAASQRGLFATIATGSRGARLLELPGVQATLVTLRRSFAFFNSIFYGDQRALERALPGLEDEYVRAGVKAWTVWVPPGDGEALAIVEAAGYLQESSPMLMGAAISAIAARRARAGRAGLRAHLARGGALQRSRVRHPRAPQHGRRVRACR